MSAQDRIEKARGDAAWALFKASVAGPAPTERLASAVEKAYDAVDALVAKVFDESRVQRGPDGRFGTIGGATREAPVHREARRQQLEGHSREALTEHLTALRGGRPPPAYLAGRGTSETVFNILQHEGRLGVVHGEPESRPGARRQGASAADRARESGAPSEAQNAARATASATPDEARQATARATSQAAETASRQANQGGTASDHDYAASAHQDAARAHADAGNVSLSAAHNGLASGHQAEAARLRQEGAAMERSHDASVQRLRESAAASAGDRAAGGVPEHMADNAAAGAALAYFHDLANGARSPDQSVVNDAMRARMLNAGLIEQNPDYPNTTYRRITAAGRDLARLNPTPRAVGTVLRNAEAAMARGGAAERDDMLSFGINAVRDDPGSRMANPPAVQQANDRAARQAAERERVAAEARARASAREAAERARPGRTPATAIVPQPGPDGKIPKGPGGTCAAASFGKPDGTYVMRERSEHKVTKVEPVKLNMVNTPANMRAIFGDKMPDKASLEKVWGDEQGGITCKADEPSVGSRSVSFSGNIYKADPSAPGGQRRIGEFTRSFHRDSEGNLQAGHDLFRINYADDQGGGLGAKMIGQAFHAYKAMGVSSVTVHPAWVGPYAWASFGYNVSARELSGMKERLAPFLEKHGIPSARAKEVANQCTALHHFADLDLTREGKDASKGDPGLAIHHVSDQQNRDGTHPEFDLHLGAKFLLTPASLGGGKWGEGVIDLANPRSPSYERVKSRLGV